MNSMIPRYLWKPSLCSSIFLVLLILCISVHGIFEDQVGEADWKSENVGFITDSVVQDSSLFAVVSSSSANLGGVVSCLDANNGKVKWRAIINKHSSFEKILLIDYKHGNVMTSALITLTLEHDHSTNQASSWFLRSWSSDEGKLLWEMLVEIDYANRGSNGDSRDSRPVDLIYDKYRSMVTVLINNAIHFVTISHAIIITSGSWRSNHSVPSEEFIISQLLPPMQQGHIDNVQTSQRLAVGCVVGKKDMSKCTKAGFVSATFDLESASVTLAMSGGGELSPSSRYAYAKGEDFIIGTSNTPYSVNVLPISSGEKIIHLKPSASELNEALRDEGNRGSTGSISASWHTVKSDPAVSFCRKSGSGTSKCSTFAVGHSEGDWVMSLVDPRSTDAKNNCNQVISVDSWASSKQSKLYCVSTQLSAISDSFQTLDMINFQSMSDEQSLIKSVFNLKLPSSIEKEPFHHLSLHTGDGSTPLLAVIVFHTGLTMFVKLFPSVGGDKLAWSRHEAFSRLKQVIIVDKITMGEGLGTYLTSDDEENFIPTFQQRLEMQKNDIIARWSLFASSIIHQSMSLPSYISLPMLSGAVKLAPKEKSISKLKTFGFDKIAITLSHSHLLTYSVEDKSGVIDSPFISFSQAQLQISAIELLRGSSDDVATPLWTVHPVLPPSAADALVSFIKLVPPASAVIKQHVLLIVGTADGNTYMWNINTMKGADVDSGASAVCNNATFDGAGYCAASTGDHSNSRGESLLTQSVGTMDNRVSFIPSDAHLPRGVLSVTRLQLKTKHTLLAIVHELKDTVDVVPISIISESPTGKLDEQESDLGYIHRLDVKTGKLLVYKISKRPCNDTTFHLAHCVYGELVSTSGFSPVVESIVAVTYLNPADTIHSKVSILGDDSVLLKYVNRNVILVSTISPPEAAREDYFDNLSNADATSYLTLHLVDVISGNVIKRIVHEAAVKPVNVVMVENMIVVSYWNSKARRAEVSTTALYEGAIDRYELSPFSSNRKTARDTNKYSSAYNFIPPMAMQKTYTVHKPVSALQHTVTAKGIANKNIILGLTNGQVFSIDMRLMHPRKPMSDPSPTEKQEGLMKYSPFLLLDAQSSAITHNYSLSSGPSRIESAASSLESTSLVFSYGGSCIDFHSSRVLPSRGFDILPSNFNHSLLLLVLAALLVAMLFLRRVNHNKRLTQLWA